MMPFAIRPRTLQLLGLPAVLTIAACVTVAAPEAAPVPLGGGVYSIAGAMGSGYPPDESYQRAIRFCFDQGRQLLRVDGGSAAAPGGEIRFRCVGPGEPGWKQPVG